MLPEIVGAIWSVQRPRRLHDRTRNRSLRRICLAYSREVGLIKIMTRIGSRLFVPSNGSPVPQNDAR